MNITDEKYNQLLDSGLMLDHYKILEDIKDGVKLLTNIRIKGFTNLLTKRGYIEGDKITEEGLKILATGKGKIKNPSTWAVDLHKKCQDKLIKLTGKPQVSAGIKGKAYAFLANERDLNRKLQSAIATYKLKDLDKIEKTILNYIENCHNTQNWFPILQYYIMKDSSSAMVTDMETIGEKAVDINSKLKNTKELF